MTTSFSAIATPALGLSGSDYRLALSTAYGGPVDPLAANRQVLRATVALQARADALLRGQGLKVGGVGERLRALAGDPRWLYPDDEAGRDRAVADMNARIGALRPRLARAFSGIPAGAVEVRRMPPAEAAAGRGGYREAGRDGQPGAYSVDLRAIRTRPAWTLTSVAFHETVPGHLLQLPLQAAADPQPTG